MFGLASVAYEEIPDGWRRALFFGRLANAGLCTYGELRQGKLTLRDIFDMHRMLDFTDYLQAKAMGEAQASSGKEVDIDELQRMIDGGY